MPVSNLIIVVSFGQDLALFGESQTAIECIRGERIDPSCCGTTSASQRTTPSMKERQFDSEPIGNSLQVTLSPIQTPAGGQITSVFGAVRITDHHDLPRALPRHMIRVDRLLEDRFQSCRPSLEIADFFEQRSDRQLIFQTGHIRSRRTCHRLSPAPQPKHDQHVTGSAGQADDMASQTAWTKIRHSRMQQSEQLKRLNCRCRKTVSWNVVGPRNCPSQHRLLFILRQRFKIVCHPQLGEKLGHHLAMST